MLHALVALALSSSVVAGTGASLSQESVDAVGNADAVLRVERSGMVRVTVDSPTKTACELVDHLRGPFAHSGVPGKEDCAIDVLLDDGLYKVRLASPPSSSSTSSSSSKRRKTDKPPQARLAASTFVDVDAAVELLPGTSSVSSLPSGRQLTRWLRVTERREVMVTVAGRTAGRVGLWRDGQWLVDVTPTSTVERPLPGRPLWTHTVTTVLDPGDYAVVVYGTQPQRFSVGNDDDSVFVAWDAPPASASRGELLVVPVWGFTAVRVPVGRLAAFVTLGGARTAPVTLTATTLVRIEGLLRRNETTTCVIEPEAVRPSCSLQSGAADEEATELRLQGPPGTVARLVWGPVGEEPGAFSPATSAPTFKTRSAVDHVALAGLPAGIDAAPLGCVLERVDDEGRHLATLARDLPDVGWTQAWKRRFNVDGTTTTVWLNITKPGVYSVNADDARGASCEVMRLVDGGDDVRVGAGEDGTCRLRVALPAGPIAVRLFGGRPGVQTLRVGMTGVATVVGNDDEAPPRTGCLFSSSSSSSSLTSSWASGRYRIRTSGDGGAALWSMAAWAGPWVGPTTSLSIDPGRTLSLPVAAGAGVVVSAAGGSGIACTLDGRPLSVCETGPLTSTSTLAVTTSDPARPALALLSRSPPPSPSSPLLPAWSSTPPRLPIVPAGKTAWFDLTDDTARLFVVEVERAGLYDLQTEGLLSTRCAVRTATSSDLFSGDGNGRGHNCLVQSYLKPGRYLVQVNRNGRSRGRAGLSLWPRAAWDGGELVLGDERFVQVEPATLASHRVTLKNDTTLRGGVSAPGATLSCRLDDDDGWPVMAVPHSCVLDDVVLAAGVYTLNVLPLTVSSRRALRLGEPASAPVLTGAVVHPLALNQTRRAVLSADGRDEFRFTLAAEADVGVVLGDGIQGRLYRLADDTADPARRDEVFATIAPRGGSALSLSAVATASGDNAIGDEAPADENVEEEGGSAEEDGGDGEGSEGGEGGEWGSGDGEGGSASRVEGETGWAARSSEQARADLLRATVHRPLGPPDGQRVHLSAGSWILQTESQRGDVAVGYDVRLDVRTLMPGVVLPVDAPAVVAVAAPPGGSAGLVRLRTRGATDVACRLYDDERTLVAESHGSGADWNCALAVPLAADRLYRLYVDAEVLQPGPTTLVAEFLEAKDTGLMKDGDTYRVKGRVARATVPAVRGKVTDVLLTSPDAFSCAAVDADGRVLDRQVATTRCALLLWPGDDGAVGGEASPFVVLAWTEDRPASLKAAVTQRDVRAAGGLWAAVADDAVVVDARVSARGRFATTSGARCLPRTSRGALWPCDDTVSFDPARDGERVLVAVPRGTRASIPFTEQVVDVDADAGASTERIVDTRRAFERARSSRAMLHLVDVRAVPGSASSPSCALEGGARVVSAGRCAAATGPALDSVLSLWTRPGGRVVTRVVRRAVAAPSTQVLPGDTVFVEGVARYALPSEPFRLDVAAAADAWVVQLDDADRAVDVCAPDVAPGMAGRASLARCVLRGAGGSVVVVGAAAGVRQEARFDLLRFPRVDEAPRVLADVREVRPRAPGRERLRFAAAPAERVLWIEGRGARGCSVQLDDGAQTAACTATVPAGRAGEIVVEHDERAWRAVLGHARARAAARFGSVPSSLSSSSSTAVALPAGRAEPLGAVGVVGVVGTAAGAAGAGLVERLATTRGAGVLRVRSTGGVCAVARTGVDATVIASEGLGGGCDLHVVASGDTTWRLFVRGFGGAPLSGTLAWSFSPAPTLVEGVGPETLVQGGESRAFRVDLAADGELGIGVRSDAEVLQCVLLNDDGDVVGDGCQQFALRPRGTYWLRVTAPADVGPRRFAPVVFGLKGAVLDVPDDWLRDFFRRVRPVAASVSDAGQAGVTR